MPSNEEDKVKERMDTISLEILLNALRASKIGAEVDGLLELKGQVYDDLTQAQTRVIMLEFAFKLILAEGKRPISHALELLELRHFRDFVVQLAEKSLQK